MWWYRPCFTIDMIPVRLIVAVTLLSACGDSNVQHSDGAIAVDASPTADTGARSDANRDFADGAVGVDCDFNRAIQWELLTETLQIESRDGTTCMWMSRMKNCTFDICKAHPFKILDVRIGAQGTTVRQADVNAMDWQPTHHNWNDSATIDRGDVRYELQFLFDGADASPQYTLTATNRTTNTALWGPVALLPINPR